MTVSLPWPLLAGDLLDCMGWGLLLAAGYDLCRTLVGTGFWRCLALDVLGFLAAAVVLRGYAAALSAAGVPRWYHVLGMMLGAWAWLATAAPALAGIRRRVMWGAGWPFRLAQKHLWPRIRPCFRLPKKRNRKKSRELPQKQLPKKGKMLYNSK